MICVMIVTVAEEFAAEDGNAKFGTVEEEISEGKVEGVATSSSISFSENVRAFLAAIYCLS